MRNAPPRRETPSYPIASVDHALRLIQLLRDVGPIRVADAAEELGVAPSTAHRVLAMLVYRDFAIQDEARRYHPGPAIGQAPLIQEWTQQLRAIARPFLEALTRDADETSNLMIRVGARVRFLLTVEAAGQQHIGDRQGIILPALYTAGGRALLAELPARSIEQLVTGPRASRSGDVLVASERRRLLAELAAVQVRGYARNVDDSEYGLSAVGAVVRDASGVAVAAIALAMQSARAEQSAESSYADRVLACAGRISAELASVDFRVGALGA
ncbi:MULTISPECIES: IclR family transcriptional regulator [unclassified Leucobacter]|uniref:IclR family transcriptional regulator n=1 Tax=unclassified Leucobacter TaxID=2621730 RepID=UPI00165D6F63|nr:MULTISPECIES: IclR family transcriptional regulator [unclassified Leucobacter]MBC9936491.1 IclR family transcriptional regulator [Leucobacter sp. cx-87]